jgi:pilus assembly protein Flp/PilA
MKPTFSKFFSDESGATAIEYGLIAALISVVIIAAITAVGTQLDKTFDAVKNALSGANNWASWGRLLRMRGEGS